MEKIGFIGLGIMGKPMAKHLMKAGHPLLILSKSKVSSELQKEGAKLFDSPAALAAEADTVITMLPDSPEVENIVLGEKGVLSGIKKGSLFIDMSTIAPPPVEIYSMHYSRRAWRRWTLRCRVGRPERKVPHFQ